MEDDKEKADKNREKLITQKCSADIFLTLEDKRDKWFKEESKKIENK